MEGSLEVLFVNYILLDFGGTGDKWAKKKTFYETLWHT